MGAVTKLQGGDCHASLEEVLETSVDGLFVVDDEGCVTFASARARAWLPNGEVLEGHALHAAWEDENSALAAAVLGLCERRERGTAEGAFVPDGPLLRIASHPAKIGTVLRISDAVAASARDEDASQGLLVREMNHRVKNLFAVVSSLVTMTARQADNPEDVAEAVQGRIAALARSHELAMPAATDRGVVGRTTPLKAIIEASLSPYVSTGIAQAAVDGPKVELAPAAVSPISLVLHELATNAAKYGALSHADGRLTVRWQVEDGMLQLNWSEEGGTGREDAPARTGFGSRLIQVSVDVQLGGRVLETWRRDGLSVRIAVPMDRITEQD